MSKQIRLGRLTDESDVNHPIPVSRGLFPESYFSSEKVLPALKHPPNPDSSPARADPARAQAELSHVNVRRLDRGKSKESDAVLNWTVSSLIFLVRRGI